MRTRGSLARASATASRRELHDAFGRFVVAVAQDAEPRAGHPPQPVLAVFRDEVVLAVAEEREVVVDDPLEERLALGELLRVDRGRDALDVGDDLVGPLDHGRPVLDRRPDIREHALQPRPQALEVGRLRLAHDLCVEERFELRVLGRRVERQDVEELPRFVAADADDRVDDEVDAASQPVELHAHRVDEERHVVVDDLDDRVPGGPAVLLELRRVDADLGLPRGAPCAEVELGERGAVEVRRAALEEVLGGDRAVVDADQCFEPRGLVLRKLRVRVLEGLVDQRGLRLVWLHGHWSGVRSPRTSNGEL